MRLGRSPPGIMLQKLTDSAWTQLLVFTSLKVTDLPSGGRGETTTSHCPYRNRYHLLEWAGAGACAGQQLHGQDGLSHLSRSFGMGIYLRIFSRTQMLVLH